MLDPNKVKELIGHAETLCDSIEDLPCGCEGCWLWEEDNENWECPLKKTIQELKSQM